MQNKVIKYLPDNGCWLPCWAATHYAQTTFDLFFLTIVLRLSTWLIVFTRNR